MLSRCGSEWSAQNERTTPTQMDAVSAPCRATRASASKAGGAPASAAQCTGSRPVSAAQAAAVEHGAEAGVAAGRVEVGEPRAARARGEEGAGRRQTRGAGRAVRTSGRHLGRGGAEAEPEPAVAVARLAELVERRQRVGGRR